MLAFVQSVYWICAIDTGVVIRNLGLGFCAVSGTEPTLTRCWVVFFIGLVSYTARVKEVDDGFGIVDINVLVAVVTVH